MALHMRTWRWVLIGATLVLILAGFSSVACDAGDFPVPVTTVQPPANLTVSVQLNQEGKYTTAIFRGGHGQRLLKEIQVEVIHPDGSKDSGVIGNVVGDSVMLKGSGCGDQVIATANFKNGMSYVILNEKMQYIRGICPADYSPTVDPCEEIARSPSLKSDPVQEIPVNKSVVIQANVDISRIEVQFRGGFGQNMIKTLQVHRIGPDGSKETQSLGNNIGDEVVFTATNNCMDRIAADVSFIDGTMYHFYDKVIRISRYMYL
ncbi:MAG: hypothetical protein BWY45_00425 [Euryarchaeota archaeon ADurb.Bin294]|nr:MAG: hypothetical protein BWY45_00425 [Euryarchaeota archaeon ADurb.Bin294]